MNEPRRVIGRQYLDPHQALNQPRGGSHLHVRDGRRVPQVAASPQSGDGLCQAKPIRSQVPDPRDAPPRDPLQAPHHNLARIQRRQRPAAGLGRPEQLSQVQRITPACRIHSRAQLVARTAASNRTHDRAHGALAQQCRAQDRRCFRPQRQQRRLHQGRITSPQRHQQPGRQPLQPRCEVGQPAQRGRISPMRIIDGNQ